MNLDYYQNLLEYLEIDKFLLDLTDFEKRIFIKQIRFYEVRNRILYKKNRRNWDRPIWVIRWTEVDPILYMMHKVSTARYLGIDAMYYKIADLYYWTKCIKILEIIYKHVKYTKDEQKQKEKYLSILYK